MNWQKQLDLPVSDVTERVEALSEYNPMLGMRGVRLGHRRARDLRNAGPRDFRGDGDLAPKRATRCARDHDPTGQRNARSRDRKGAIDGVAAAVRARNRAIYYRLGVMVETPRAALRAEDIAQHAAFLVFGTNDLTQMTYGLSRDDAGRFMSAYVQQGVYAEDPFHTLDVEGVGELLSIGATRGRLGNPDVVLSICGEHGGNADIDCFLPRAGIRLCVVFTLPCALGPSVGSSARNCR